MSLIILAAIFMLAVAKSAFLGSVSSDWRSGIKLSPFVRGGPIDKYLLLKDRGFVSHMDMVRFLVRM